VPFSRLLAVPAEVFSRLVAVPAEVMVDGQTYCTRLRDKPAVGATLSTPFPVVVVEARSESGGWVIVAERVDQEAWASLSNQLAQAS